MNMPGDDNLVNSSPPREEVIDQLLTALVHEEMALANLLNAGASKIHAFIGTEFDFPTHPSNQEIISMNKAALHLLRSAVMKDWFLLNKLEEIFAFDERQFPTQTTDLFSEDVNEEMNEDLDSVSGEESESTEQEKNDFSDSNGEHLGEQNESPKLFEE